ncbi:hypothetical protein A3860_15270 [Niastella vici]|uniref:Uncharacterized protein n=1 Tax=Niastella vici TaxID=1703345 RepID=A0A1V9G630_9BACT|nr:hypothetical protein [Niastella vici]OQP65948.1 hypothetical protein A3860_15270 [Niastella vici]
MNSAFSNTLHSLRAPGNYFWRWADKGNVIEWRDGDTICYRDELMAILKKLSPEGLPAFGSILLVFSACREKLNTPAAKEGILYPMLRLLDFYEKNSPDLKEFREMMLAAIRFLQIVAALPTEFRSGNNRVWLLYVIFTKIESKFSGDEATSMIDFFSRGNVDHFVFKDQSYTPPSGYRFSASLMDSPAFTARIFKDDMQWLQKAGEVFPSAQELELAVRTGLKELPNSPELEVPTQESGDLLQQLQQDPTTTGLAQLTQRLIAALNIPMHAHGSSDQLFGGVSDITNRGNFDRLLLSELAHDDLSLMARLANNEALYLRREELPSNPEKQRILLIDITLRMWGLPRVFAVSAALACAHNNKAKARILSYALSGNSFAEIDLLTKNGVVNSLEQLDAALHCGRALTLFMGQPVVKADDEVFLVTGEESIHNVLFQSILSSLKKPVNFLVTVNRAGQLQFYEFINGRRKLLSEARFNLQELLFNTNKKEKSTDTSKPLGNVPAIMKQTPCPLFFPASKIKFNVDSFFELKKDHLICITIDQRVLYWNSKTRGAQEIIAWLEPGRFCFGAASESSFYILAYAAVTKMLRLYKVSPDLNYTEITKLTENLEGITDMGFDAGCFYIKSYGNPFVVEAATGKVNEGNGKAGFDNIIDRYRKRFTNLHFVKKYINDGYTTLNSVKQVYINGDGELGFDDRHLGLNSNNGCIVISIDHNREMKTKNERILRANDMEVPYMGLANTTLKFSKFVWNDGSEVLADSRGLLHLRSADKTIPEITIVMVMGKPAACWAADGRVCGAIYFTGVDTAESGDITGFYYNYIQRFIDRIKKYATVTEI